MCMYISSFPLLHCPVPLIDHIESGGRERTEAAETKMKRVNATNEKYREEEKVLKGRPVLGQEG